VAFLTVSEFARTVDVDAATIVRFAQRLGYRGYPELQDDIREEVKRQLYALKKPVPASTKPEALFGTALEQMERNLEAMQAALDPDAFKQFVAAIRKAPRIHLVAPGSLRGHAAILRAALMHVGKATFSSDRDPQALALAVQYVGRGDAVIILETGMMSPVPENLSSLVRRRGARTALLAGAEATATPLTADWVFQIPNQSILKEPSYVAMAAFISGLHLVLLQPDEDEAAERYQAAYEGLLPESKGTRKAHTVA
jgi:DNA-binding MurR/RpiR family transcriptional regulator